MWAGDIYDMIELGGGDVTTLLFPIFTRLCEPYIRLSYVLTGDGHVNRELYEPVRNDTVVMIDIGLRMASLSGVPVTMDYIKYVKHYANRYVTLFVIPDSWCYTLHIDNARRFISLAKRLGNVDNMVPIFVVHYYLSYIEEYKSILEELQEVFPIVLIGVPGNIITLSNTKCEPVTKLKCARRPVICNHYIETVIRDAYMRDQKTHILGITKTTLNHIIQHKYGVAAADTDKPRGNGRGRMASRREYCQVFREWLGNYDQPGPEQWLNELIR